ncbi:sensor histidine kinase [Dyadobacter subterraneus]|uniref:Sensor histidine kinase n=1 Tax=Dyadobacter subterraneus TaxID=2773304 RepID=A0ABR9W504_9BACT|nr:ATP-binding protein [Dyadobacter subterraneus]MBE9460542.1 sensor histidine kinase [Dyadobacter subterraneus]
MSNDNVALMVISLTAILLLLGTYIIIFLFIFRRRQMNNDLEKATLQAQFSQEILKSQIEVQNSTLQQVGEELHDNIGQLLSVAKINLNILEGIGIEPESQEYIQQTNEIIGQSIQDLRSLTKSLDGDFVQQFGLQESMTHELQRIRKTKKFETEITLTGESYTLGYEREIILFRIFQEFLNNSLKHSEAKNIIVKLNYGLAHFNLTLSDDGKGFDYEKVTTHNLLNSGAGLRNMARRCELIGAKCNLESSIGKGTFLDIEVPIKNSVNT